MEFAHRKWMYDRTHPNRAGLRVEFINGVKEFIAKAKTRNDFLIEGTIRCPCAKCKCIKLLKPDKVEFHILKNGFMDNYYVWTVHGENDANVASVDFQNAFDGVDNPVENNNVENSRFNEMLRDAFGMFPGVQSEPNDEAKRFYGELTEASRPLYEGSMHSKLSVAVRLLSIKSDYSISQAGMDSIIRLMNELNPSKIDLPKDFYTTKKMGSKLGLSSERIDCCEKGCMLFYKDDAALENCKFCNQARYKEVTNVKRKKVPLKSMHYLPLIPRLKRLYASMSSAPHMRWHYEHKRPPGVLCHPSDGEAWKHFDRVFPNFASEPRNIRLGLCSDGFTPFAVSAAPYSCWPVFVTPYNLPPELCMTSPYLFLTCIIPGPNNPKNLIDIYMQPLIDELKLLWNQGVETYDVFHKQNFIMRAALMWTINDFPAYGMLSGWSTAGKLACPCCMEDTKAFRLKHGGKNSWFDCHRRFLPKDHEFRRNTSAFMKNQTDFEDPPATLSPEEIWHRVRDLPKVTDSPSSKIPGYGVTHNWTKQSIFWELPYWKHNLLRHNLDVMHIEKNFFDNIFNTMMDINNKTKDNLKARIDLKEYCRRSELYLTYLNNKIQKPKASYTFTLDEKREICDWVKNLKMPDGYASNLSRCVDMKEGKLMSMKSHDCHIFMESLMPIAFKSLHDRIWKPITEISLFFKELCSSTLRVENLNYMESNICLALNKLAKIFPPGFFNVMEHLPIHLVHEARLGGPVQGRWMYPFERIIGKSKRTIKNRWRIEGAMREAYRAREMSNFDSYYFESDVPCLRNRPNRHDDGGIIDHLAPPFSIFNYPGKGGPKYTPKRKLTEMELKSATTHVLLNCPEVQPYHSYFVGTYGNDVVYSRFSDWFKEHVHNPVNVVDVVNVQFLRDISWGPDHRVRIMSKYFINGYKFHTEEWSKGKKTNNSGVWVKGEGDIDYYGVLQEIIELEYVVGWPKKKLVIFRCKWYDPDSSGTKVHPQYKIIEINHTRQYRFYDPFIIAQNVKQVYYVPYPLCKNKSSWRVVIKTKPVGRVEVENALDVAYQNDISSVEAMVDDELAGELQHSEGIYEEFDATVLQSDLNNYGEGTSRANEEESQTDEYETSDEELLEENEINDEEEFDSDYESNEED